MSLSGIFWGVMRSIDRSGRPRLAAALANAVCRDRHFSVDADGDRVNRQVEATFVCPDIDPPRYAYIREKIIDNWLFDYQPKKGDMVFDIGAGIGEEAVIFEHMGCRVVSVEAHPRTYRCLTKTIARSNLKNVQALECAIMDRDGEITISNTDDHLANGIGATEGVAVPARSVASLCRELGLDTIDFLKMNIEGAEKSAVLGFGDVKIGHMVISCHDFLNIDELKTMAAVQAHLTEQGYRITTRPDHAMSYTRANIYASLP
jgi:FkbM family methyltransferase